MKRLIVGISGASGAIYGVRLLQVLRDVADVETHLVMSQAARQTLSLETDFSLREVQALADVTHDARDIAASISSGSFQTLGMVILPCSIKFVYIKQMIYRKLMYVYFELVQHIRNAIK